MAEDYDDYEDVVADLEDESGKVDNWLARINWTFAGPMVAIIILILVYFGWNRTTQIASLIAVVTIFASTYTNRVDGYITMKEAASLVKKEIDSLSRRGNRFDVTLPEGQLEIGMIDPVPDAWKEGELKEFRVGFCFRSPNKKSQFRKHFVAKVSPKRSRPAVIGINKMTGNIEFVGMSQYYVYVPVSIDKYDAYKDYYKDRSRPT